MDYNELEWIIMNYNGFEWIIMDQNGLKWIRMDNWIVNKFFLQYNLRI